MVQPLRPVQSRDTEPTAYELKLAGAIEEVFGTGAHDLAGLLAGLNERQVWPSSGGEWTEQNLRDEMNRLES